MATDFWKSSHYRNWITDRVTLHQAREDDLNYATPRDIGLITIFFANVIARLGKRLDLRQQVIATAIVFFRRFYLKSSYCETEPFFVAAACCYLAAKVEESPCHLKSVVGEARGLFGSEYGIRTIPSDHTKLGEMEFYLLEDLEFNLTVYHPYSDLANLCACPESGKSVEEMMAMGPEVTKGKFILEEGAMQTAWFIISDSLRTELCLLYPPYIVAVAALYMTCVLHSSISTKLHPPSMLAPYAAAAAAAGKDGPALNAASIPPSESTPRDQILNFLAGLNVSLEVVGSVCQQIMSMYDLWDSITDHSEQDRNRRAERKNLLGFRGPGGASISGASTPTGAPSEDPKEQMLTTEKDIVAVLQNMRARRENDLMHPASGQPLAVNKRMIRVSREPPD